MGADVEARGGMGTLCREGVTLCQVGGDWGVRGVFAADFLRFSLNTLVVEFSPLSPYFPCY